ncbi:Protein of unknown function [Gryllus bimaculatus]|nr:Protein of unknown function [Gryllus bimaculatus]
MATYRNDRIITSYRIVKQIQVLHCGRAGGRKVDLRGQPALLLRLYICISRLEVQGEDLPAQLPLDCKRSGPYMLVVKVYGWAGLLWSGLSQHYYDLGPGDKDFRFIM